MYVRSTITTNSTNWHARSCARRSADGLVYITFSSRRIGIPMGCDSFDDFSLQKFHVFIIPWNF